MTQDLVAMSKRLSYVLRHKPSDIGIALDPNGWVDVDELLAGFARAGKPLTRGTLDLLVSTSDKQRFQLVDGRIRAAQGHSVSIDLDLAPELPPDRLWHGTVERFLPQILSEGLRPAQRTHVHLSADLETAVKVGARRGKPVVLAVDAKGMSAAGDDFFCAANGVWLTKHVPPEWLSLEEDPRQ